MSGVWPFGSLMICVGSRVGALDNPRLANLKKVAVAEASGMGVRNLSAGKLGRRSFQEWKLPRRRPGRQDPSAVSKHEQHCPHHGWPSCGTCT